MNLILIGNGIVGQAKYLITYIVHYKQDNYILNYLPYLAVDVYSDYDLLFLRFKPCTYLKKVETELSPRCNHSRPWEQRSKNSRSWDHCSEPWECLA